MNEPTNTEPAVAADATCSACGRPFIPWTKHNNGRPISVCFPCGMLNLAGHCEHVEEGDSLKEISDGEQYGAFFRALAGEPNSIIEPRAANNLFCPPEA